MDVYERNLQRLKKAERLLDLAVHSEALYDAPAHYAWAGRACVMLAARKQEEYIAERAKKRP